MGSAVVSGRSSPRSAPGLRRYRYRTGRPTIMTAPDRAAINRRNAQKSTGPRTDEGKARSRFNALKHGMTAQIPVLPGRLFWDPRGPLALYPPSAYRPGQPRVSSSGLADDPDDPARLILRLEATAAGCQWLLDRWAELRDRLEQGQTWQSPDKLKAV